MINEEKWKMINVVLRYNTTHFIFDKTLSIFIRITCLCDLYTFAPHFYIVKEGFTRVYIFLIFALKHRLCVPMIYVLSKNKKNITIFHLKIIIFTAMKNRRILHRHVIVL